MGQPVNAYVQDAAALALLGLLAVMESLVEDEWVSQRAMGAELVGQVLGMCDEVLAAVRRKLTEKGAWRTPLVVGGPSLGC